MNAIGTVPKTLLGFLLLQALPLAAADISGTWALKGDIAGNPINLTCTFKQDGASLAGTCKGNSRPDRVLTGEVKDQNVKFQYDLDYNGDKLTVIYTGTLQTDSSMKGSVDASGNSGDFTATKQK